MALVGTIITAVSSVIDKIFPNKTEADKAKAQLALLHSRGDLEKTLKQLEINANEAKSGSFFLSGWRPAVGWICSIAFAYHFLIYPMLTVILALCGIDVDVLPIFDLSTLFTVLGGLLGIGGMRSYEKFKGVHNKH